ncbi:MAG: murein L,D-transpeptidase catalytic domain family protein [Chitinophagaceae bacterium]|nr:murein L,D-transpeptidase catalytic domain family protein [Chitinophagaceae bacterium]
MKKSLKLTWLLAITFLFSIVHYSVAVARVGTPLRLSSNSTTLHPAWNLEDSMVLNLAPVKSLYDSLQLDLAGLSRPAFDYAQKGWKKLKAQGRLMNTSVLAIVDFSRPSSEKRLFVIDLDNYEVLHHTWVAHGRNSGKEMVTSFFK